MDTDDRKRTRCKKCHSKVERRDCAPTLGQFERYCKALSVTPWYILRMTEFLVNGE